MIIFYLAMKLKYDQFTQFSPSKDVAINKLPCTMFEKKCC